MSTCVNREIAKMTVENKEIYVCMYIYEGVVTNLSFFKKGEKAFEELLRHHISAEEGQELIKRVRANKVEKVTPLEAKSFNQWLNKQNFSTAKEIKEFINKTSQDMKADYVGEVAGIHYIMATTKNVPFKQVYLLQQSPSDDFEVGKIPLPFIEMVLLDYVHHAKIEKEPTYIAIDQNQYMGIKMNHKNASIIYVVNIHVSDDSISANKAYMISKKNFYEYRLLPIQDSTPVLMENLKGEAKIMIDTLIKKLNIQTN